MMVVDIKLKIKLPLMMISPSHRTANKMFFLCNFQKLTQTFILDTSSTHQYFPASGLLVPEIFPACCSSRVMKESARTPQLESPVAFGSPDSCHYRTSKSVTFTFT